MTKPTPTAIKRKTGNPGRRPLNDREPLPPDGKLTCPAYLTGIARYKWHRLVPALVAMGTAKPVDEDIVAAYCQEYARWRNAEELLAKHGPLYQTQSGNLIQNPLVGVSNRAQTLMLKYGAELGIGAATRSRIQAEKEPTLDDQLEGILRERH